MNSRCSANAQPLDAVITPVAALPKGGLEGTLLARDGPVPVPLPLEVDRVGGIHVLRVDLAGAFVHRAVAAGVAATGRGRQDGLELVQAVLGEMEHAVRDLALAMARLCMPEK